MFETILKFTQIIIADLILSGDNALIIGMAVAGLPPKLRQRAIIFGLIFAALLRIIFAVVATQLLNVPGLLFVGGLLLMWVCWRLFCDIRKHAAKTTANHSVANHSIDSQNQPIKPENTLKAALISIIVADFSMSLDNVLAVAAIADGDTIMLVFGLALAILLMAFAATIISKILVKYQWISWLGLFVLIYVTFDMLYRGTVDSSYGIGPMLGFFEGFDLKKGH